VKRKVKRPRTATQTATAVPSPLSGGEDDSWFAVAADKDNMREVIAELRQYKSEAEMQLELAQVILRKEEDLKALRIVAQEHAEKVVVYERDLEILKEAMAWVAV
jgi:hypothetical protein